MNKILNWTVGSFFRTIGRIVAYLGIGLLIAYILGNSDINWGITDLFFDKVDALTVTESVKNSGSGYFSIENANNYLPYNDFYYTTVTSGWIDRAIYFNFNPRIYTGNDDYIEFPFIASMPSQTEINYPVQDDFVTCRTWSCDTYNSSGNCSMFKCLNWYTSGTSTVNDHLITDYEVNSLSFYARIEFADANGNWSGWKSCSIQGNSFICPLVHDLYIKFIQIIINYNPPKSSQWYFGLQRGYNLYRGQDIQNAVEQNTQAINQQSQQQQQNHNQTQSYLEDSNTTQAESEATDFFEDFEVEDHGGLSGIITAPLSTIQSLLNNTCTNLVLPLPFVNENLTLPCMNSIYIEHFGAFFTIYQTIILAIISYRCLRSLFYDVRGFINPDDDRIEVMDL